MKKLLYILFLMISTVGYSQSHTYNSVDSSLFKKINDVRIKNNKPTVILTDKYYNKAYNHCEYYNKKNDTIISEKFINGSVDYAGHNEGKLKAEERFKDMYKCGEIMEVYTLTNYNNKKIYLIKENLLDTLIEGYVNSPGHFRIMIGDYKCVSVSHYLSTTILVSENRKHKINIIYTTIIFYN